MHHIFKASSMQHIEWKKNRKMKTHIISKSKNRKYWWVVSMVKLTSVFFATLKECKIFFYLLVYFIWIGWKLTAILSEGWFSFTWNIINESIGYAHNCRIRMLWLSFNFRIPFLHNLCLIWFLLILLCMCPGREAGPWSAFSSESCGNEPYAMQRDRSKW
jgi:hypothetical protein